jgi:hypothetical protein
MFNNLHNEYIKMSVETICKEKYVDGKLVSRICIKGNLFTLQSQFRPPDYELSEVSSCDSCPTYPLVAGENQIEELKDMLKEILDIIKKK